MLTARNYTFSLDVDVFCVISKRNFAHCSLMDVLLLKTDSRKPDSSSSAL